MNPLGTHLLVELWSGNGEKMNNLKYLEATMARAAQISGATVLKTAFQDFNPHGVSGVVVIAESHLTIHTWPEHGYAAVDIFTCGTKVDPWKAARFLQQELEAIDMEIRDFQRGLPPRQNVGIRTGDVVRNAACGNTHRQ
jgi:S-adenosylmethionine decarboxylase